MKSLIGSLIGLVLSVHVGAEPLLEGRVRLSSGQPAAGHVRLEVFNILGQRLATLVDGEQSAGTYTAQWDATDVVGRAVGAGVYIYRLSSGGMTESRRMVLVDGQAGIPAIGAATQGPVRSKVEGEVEADGSVYGLTVSGEGLVAYVDPAFQVGVDEEDIRWPSRCL